MNEQDSVALTRETEFILAISDKKNASAQAMRREIDVMVRYVRRLKYVVDTSPKVILNSAKRKKVGQLRTKLVQNTGKLNHTVYQLNTLLQHTPAAGLYHRMLALPRVLSIAINKPELIIETDTLFGKCRAGFWHRVGSFNVRVNMVKKNVGGICWHNHSGTMPINEYGMGSGNLHPWQGPPNISNNGAVHCFGDAKPDLERAFIQEDWETIVAIAVRYPECVGNSNRISHWPVVRVEDVPRWYLDTFGRTTPVPDVDWSQVR